jgi:hypothetical protein
VDSGKMVLALPLFLPYELRFFQAKGRWHWAMIVSPPAPTGGATAKPPVALACSKDKIAVAFPSIGVRLWVWSKGAFLLHQ